MTNVKFNGNEYPVFEVEVDGQEYYVANYSLAGELLINGERYVNDQAKRIDEAIYFYVDDSITTDEEAEEYTNRYCY